MVSTFDHPELVKLGRADLMEEVMIGESKLTRFSGCAGGAACSIVLRGSSQHFLDEAEVNSLLFFFSLVCFAYCFCSAPCTTPCAYCLRRLVSPRLCSEEDARRCSWLRQWSSR